MAELLLANKAEVNAANNNGWTPLRVAEITGQPGATDLLLVPI